MVSFDGQNDWYFGTDGKPGGKADFAGAALHELGHGLGFLGGLYVSYNVGFGWTTPGVKDVSATASGAGASVSATLSVYISQIIPRSSIPFVTRQ